MAEEETGSRRPGFVETLREGWKPGGRRSKATEESAETSETATTERSKEPTKEVAAAKEANGAETKPVTTATGEKPPATEAAAASTGDSKVPDPNLAERMEGLQGWMAEIERKQRRMTFFGAAGTVLALLAAGGALYLGIAAPNTASKDDFDDLEAQVDTLQQQITEATADQNRLKAINASIESLSARMSAAEQRASQNATEIAAAKAQAQAAQQAAAAAQAAPVAPTTPTTPPAKQQP